MKKRTIIKYIPEKGDKVIALIEGGEGLECFIESITPHWINVINPNTNEIDYCPDHGMLDWSNDLECWVLNPLYC